MRLSRKLKASAFAALLTPFFAAAQDGASKKSPGSPAKSETPAKSQSPVKSATPAKGKKNGRKKNAVKKAEPLKKKSRYGERLREQGESMGGHQEAPVKKTVDKTSARGHGL
jgi:hypothetical protein